MIPQKNSITFLLFVICFLEFKKNNYICTHKFASASSLDARFAGMVKLVDMPDLGSGAARRVGSSPITRTLKNNKTLKIKVLRVFYFLFCRNFAEKYFIFNSL